MMSSAVKTAGTQVEFSAPEALFKTRILAWIGNHHEYDVSPDVKDF